MLSALRETLAAIAAVFEVLQQIALVIGGIAVGAVLIWVMLCLGVILKGIYGK
ncbi:hypothetical protein [Sphingopyxis flava]|uniref:Uncharacterized protein n=1 Tax=Sphingopyxis flava TaxID=1507287 RepID=A0A1T5BSD5_9SPHN|nr:hypothetical protein [Sphingopyxis flava]SKB50087.1 hypothetical protein SAMN06295937_100798 [Sphingopyxis flava]